MNNEQIEISDNACTIIRRMMRELCTCKYLYKEIAEGCYDALVENFLFEKPTESREKIVKMFFMLMNNIKLRRLSNE